MKTIEMIKKADENNGTYRTNDLYFSIKYGFTDVNKISWGGDAFVSINDLLKIDTWEEVLQSVTFQEALNSRIKGKTIKSVWDDIEYVYDGDSDTLVDHNDEAMSIEEIEEADWYIID